MNIVLMGYRGSGKTTVGKKLANELWKTFVDVDAEVCKRFGGLTIREIWDTRGEAAFRDMEVQVITELLQRQDQVIALGGGTLMQPGGRAAVEQAAQTVRIYLKCDPAVLAERIAADTTTAASRPSLTALGGGEEEVRAVLAEREPVYEAVADRVLDVSHIKTVSDVVEYIVRRCL